MCAKKPRLSRAPSTPQPQTCMAATDMCCHQPLAVHKERCDGGSRVSAGGCCWPRGHHDHHGLHDHRGCLHDHGRVGSADALTEGKGKRQEKDGEQEKEGKKEGVETNKTNKQAKGQHRERSLFTHTHTHTLSLSLSLSLSLCADSSYCFQTYQCGLSR